MKNFEICVCAKEILHTSEGFVLRYASAQELIADLERFKGYEAPLDGLIVGDDILVRGVPVQLETKQRLAMQCFRTSLIVSERDIAWQVYRDLLAKHTKIWHLMRRTSEILEKHGYCLKYQKGFWKLLRKFPEN